MSKGFVLYLFIYIYFFKPEKFLQKKKNTSEDNGISDVFIKGREAGRAIVV